MLFDETDGIDFEAVAATEPDVILASYSGLTQDEYDTLEKIAPVVAYPEIAWGTSVQDMIKLNSEALGLAAEGEELIADLDTKVAESFAAHESLAGKKIMFAFIDPTDLSQIGFYTSHDTRPGFVVSAGMANPQIVEEASAETEEFYVTRSAEDAEAFADVDVFVTYGEPDGKPRRADPGRPAAVEDPRDPARRDRHPRGVHPAGRLGQPVAAVHRLGHRRVLRRARHRGRQVLRKHLR